MSQLFPAEAADLLVATVEIRAAAISHIPGVTNVRDINGLDDDRDIARSLVETSAARVRLGAEVADITKGVGFGAEIARPVDPCAHANIDIAPLLGRKRGPSDAGTFFISALPP